MKAKTISRDITPKKSDTFGHLAIPVRDSLSYLLFLIVPALLCGCNTLETVTYTPLSPEASTFSDSGDSTRTSINIEGLVSCLDVFTFNDDIFERLDTYQRFEHGQLKDNICSIGTCSGKKRIIMLANHPSEKYDWIDINCAKALVKKTFELELERTDYPIMIADYQIEAGVSFSSQMECLTGEVILRSIRCDFSDKSYSGAVLTDIKVYLTNVNASCGIWNNTAGSPERIINQGRLNIEDISKFTHPELVYQELDCSVGHDKVYPEIRLKAYPNYHPYESIGTPFTKLVIEGKIMGNTYYYPIAINRNTENDKYGLRRNMCYIYDITIRRSGLTDPDGNIEASFANIDIEVEKWKERDWYDIRF